MRIIYFDNHIVIAEKPFNLPTQKSFSSENNLEDMVRVWLKNMYNKPNNVFLHATHRLDSCTSGIVIFAKTSKALSRLNEMIRENKIKKCYYAVVEKDVANSECELISYLKHKNHIAKVSSTPKDGYKIAKLRFYKIKSNNNFTLLKIFLDTGRYHQIRAQLSFVGHPIVGDKKYKSKYDLGENKIALIHKEIEFTHPVKNEPMSFSIDLPHEYPFNLFL